jgi:hypothetical protein
VVLGTGALPPNTNDVRNTFLPTEHGVLTIASVGPRSFPKCPIGSSDVSGVWWSDHVRARDSHLARNESTYAIAVPVPRSLDSPSIQSVNATRRRKAWSVALLLRIGLLGVGVALAGCSTSHSSGPASTVRPVQSTTKPSSAIVPTGGSSSSAPTPPDGAFVSASTPTMAIGSTVTFHGNHCSPLGRVLVSFGSGDAYTPGSIGKTLVGSDGMWSITLQVAQDSMVGILPVQAYCWTSNSSNGWIYPQIGACQPL